MDPRLVTTLDQHIDWLKTFGHVHKDTVKFMERMRDILIELAEAQDMDDLQYSYNVACDFLEEQEVEFHHPK